MKVLFLMFVFPDMNKSFNMYTALVEEFATNGHEVVVIAPGENKTNVVKEGNIDVLRVRTLPIKNVSKYIKGVSNLLLPMQYGRALKKYYPNNTFDLIIIPTPPITLVSIATRLKKQYGAKLYLILRDIFPQNAVDLKFMKKGGFLHRFFLIKEKRLYKVADQIGCMSQGNIDYLIHHNPGISSEKLHELKNFQKLFKGFDFDQNELKRKFGLENKFVVVFGGNMGKPQQLENVLYLAEKCSTYKDVILLLLGEGVRMKKLSEQIVEKGIKNVVIHGTIPKQEYQDLICVCDVGLISLHKDFTIPNIPSKALDYLNVGIPVLASLDRATDFGKILDENELGLWSFADEPENLFKNFELLYNNKNRRVDFGLNARKYFETYLQPYQAYNTIIDQIV